MKAHILAISFILLFVIAFMIVSIIDNRVKNYKIAYYEKELDDRNVDIDRIRNITLTEIRHYHE